MRLKSTCNIPYNKQQYIYILEHMGKIAYIFASHHLISLRKQPPELTKLEGFTMQKVCGSLTSDMVKHFSVLHGLLPSKCCHIVFPLSLRPDSASSTLLQVYLQTSSSTSIVLL